MNQIFKKTMMFIIRIILMTYVLLFLAALLISNQLMFPYQESSYSNDLSGLKLIQNSKSGEQLAVLYRPVKDSNQVVLYFHGNAEDIGHLDELADVFNQLGFHFMAFDYRGYGLSTGEPNEQAIYQDGQLFLNHVKSLGFKSQNMVLWGRSIGGGVATYLAENNEVKFLVLESAFTSAFKALTQVAIMPFDRFDNLTKVSNIKAPLLLFHGEDDQVVRVSHGLALFDAHQGPKHKAILNGAGHNDLWFEHRDRIVEYFLAFKRQHHKD